MIYARQASRSLLAFFAGLPYAWTHRGSSYRHSKSMYPQRFVVQGLEERTRLAIPSQDMHPLVFRGARRLLCAATSCMDTHSSHPSIQIRTRLFRAYRASRHLWASARSSSSVRDQPTSSSTIGPPTSPSDLLFHHLPVAFSPCSFPYRMTLTHHFSRTHPGLPLSSHRAFPLPSSL